MHVSVMNAIVFDLTLYYMLGGISESMGGRGCAILALESAPKI